MENNFRMTDVARNNAILISIGDELLIGQTVNTNASWIAKQLTERGIEVLEMYTISDNKDQMLRFFKTAMEKVELVICTGGLGPTKDDLTPEVLGELFDEPMVFNDKVYSWIRKFKQAQKKEVNELHRKQAILPEGFKYFRNTKGTAPAMLYKTDETFFIALPGVPYEMKDLMLNEIFPFLSGKISGKIIRMKNLLTAGVPESEIAGKLANIEKNLPSKISLSYLPGLAKVKIRINSKAETAEEAEKALERTESEIREKLGDVIYGVNDESLEEVVGKLLMRKKWRMATAESCTGGYISHLITSVPGASSYFNGAVVAYSNDVKKELLRVSSGTLEIFGAVSEQTVVEMVKGVCTKLEVNCAIAVSGIAGPDGGTPEKPVGMICIAVGTLENQEVETIYLNHNRGLNIEKTAITALNMLRLFLQRT